MNVDPEELQTVKGILWQGEVVKGTFKQRRIGPGGSVTVPTSVIVTDSRVIIVNRATLGFRKDYEVIPYSKIASVRFEKGIISSSVFIRVEGYDRDQGLLKNGREEGEIDGLSNKDAADLAEFVNMKLGLIAEPSRQETYPEPNSQETDLDSKVGSYTFCNKCGTKNPAGSRFCSKCGTKICD